MVILHGDPIYVPEAAKFLSDSIAEQKKQGRVATAVIVEQSSSLEFAKRHLSENDNSAGEVTRFFISKKEAKWWLVQRITLAQNEVTWVYINAQHTLVFSADPEFINRKDCYMGLKDYGIEFKEVIPCHVTQRYEGLGSGEASVFAGYETDPQVFNKQVLRLTDPEQFSPPYLALPLVSRPTLEKVPGLQEALNKLHNIISTDALNALVAGLAKANNIVTRL